MPENSNFAGPVFGAGYHSNLSDLGVSDEELRNLEIENRDGSSQFTLLIIALIVGLLVLLSWILLRMFFQLQSLTKNNFQTENLVTSNSKIVSDKSKNQEKANNSISDENRESSVNKKNNDLVDYSSQSFQKHYTKK